MREKKILKYQQTVLKLLADKIDDFYLAGGTALSLFYFQHRISVDLDFFTHNFSDTRIREIVKGLQDNLKTKIGLVGQNLERDRTRMMVYNIYFTLKEALKIDFVDDVIDLIKRPKVTDGIKILSLEDIYMRKLYAIIGVVKIFDQAGCSRFAGGRIDAKDYFDLYFLSHTFIPLSKFVKKYCDSAMVEALIRWFRTYDRMTMIDGILTLDTDKKIDCKNIEKHFAKEIDAILEQELEGI